GVLVAGCQVDQAEEVRQYRRIVDLEQVEVVESQPLSLRDALLLSNQQYEELDIEGEAYLRTIITRKRTVANFLPTVSLGGRYSIRDSVDGGNNTGNNTGNNGSTGGSGSSSDDDTFDITA